LVASDLRRTISTVIELAEADGAAFDFHPALDVAHHHAQVFAALYIALTFRAGRPRPSGSRTMALSARAPLLLDWRPLMLSPVVG
jgi:hypothetical protein